MLGLLCEVVGTEIKDFISAGVEFFEESNMVKEMCLSF